MNRLPLKKHRKSFAGSILVASPEVSSPPFDQSVILILQHSETGAHGTILNKTLEASVGSLWEQLGGESVSLEDPVHMGGPTSGPLFALHQQKHLAEMKTANNVYLSATKEHLKQLVADQVATRDKPLHLFVGHVKWDANQLEQEVARGMWMQLPATADLIFNDHDDKWFEAMRAVGRKFWVDTLGAKHVPLDPMLN